MRLRISSIGVGLLKKRKSKVTKISSTIISILIATSVLVPLALLGAPLVKAAGTTKGVSTVITNALWIINPGGTFLVKVEVINNDNVPRTMLKFMLMFSTVELV